MAYITGDELLLEDGSQLNLEGSTEGIQLQPFSSVPSGAAQTAPPLGVGLGLGLQMGRNLPLHTSPPQV